MKQLKYFLLVAAVALSIVGCRKTVEVSFDNAAKEIAPQGDTIEVALKSNGEWAIESTEEWLVVSPMSGNGDATLTLIAGTNTTGEARSTEIKATTKDNTAVLTLTQGVYEEYLSVTPKEIMCAPDGGEFVVELSTNVDWFVSTPDWIRISQSEGSGDARITLTVSSIEGDLTEGREAQVFFGNLSISERVHVVQAAEPILGIDLTPSSLAFVCTGETKTVAVATEDSWTVSLEEDWVSVSQLEGQGDAEISVTVGENPIYETRSTIVLFTTAGGVQAVLAIRQEASPDPHFLEALPLEFDFGKEGGEREITIGCDTDWVFDLNCPWLSLSQMSGTGNAIVVLTAEQNLVTEPRSFEFHIKSGELFYNFTVSQAPGDTPLVVNFDSDTLFVAYVGGLQRVQLTSNTSWSLQADGWIGLNMMTSGEGDASFDVIVDSNSDPDARVGFLNAIHGGQVLATLVVVQEGKPNLLETDVIQLDVRPEGGDYVVQVTANQNWFVNVDVDWLHCNPQSGFGSGSFTITVDAAVSPRPREGHVKVGGETGSEVIITISQH